MIIETLSDDPKDPFHLIISDDYEHVAIVTKNGRIEMPWRKFRAIMAEMSREQMRSRVTRRNIEAGTLDPNDLENNE